VDGEAYSPAGLWWRRSAVSKWTDLVQVLAGIPIACIRFPFEYLGVPSLKKLSVAGKKTVEANKDNYKSPPEDIY
jgi:hypothetical protein